MDNGMESGVHGGAVVGMEFGTDGGLVASAASTVGSGIAAESIAATVEHDLCVLLQEAAVPLSYAPLLLAHGVHAAALRDATLRPRDANETLRNVGLPIGARLKILNVLQGSRVRRRATDTSDDSDDSDDSNDSHKPFEEEPRVTGYARLDDPTVDAGSAGHATQLRRDVSTQTEPGVVPPLTIHELEELWPNAQASTSLAGGSNGSSERLHRGTAGDHDTEGRVRWRGESSIWRRERELAVLLSSANVSESFAAPLAEAGATGECRSLGRFHTMSLPNSSVPQMIIAYEGISRLCLQCPSSSRPAPLSWRSWHTVLVSPSRISSSLQNS